MAIPKAAGVETEYGIMIVGADKPDPFYASDLVLRAYRQLGDPSVPTVPPLASQPGYRRSSGELSLMQFKRHESSLAHNATDLMLSNGARFYIDHAHPEYSTAECLSARLLVAADKAGERILADCLHAVNCSNVLPPDQSLLIYKNNSDYKNNSYGCHENYLLSTGLFTDLVYHRIHRVFRCLLPFLITRIIYCGSGKVGAENGTTPVGFQLSQRADFFERLFGLQTTQQRPLFNIRDEPHADPDQFRRLHVIPGDANMAEYSTFLKIGTTQLVLQMLEDDFIKVDLTLKNPLNAVQTVSRDLTFSQSLELEVGEPMTALQIQHVYLDLARRYLEQKDGSDDEWNIWYEWEDALNMLPDQTKMLATRLDWAIKFRILDHYLKSGGGTWEEVAAWQRVIEEPDQSATAREMAQAADLPWQGYDKQRELYFGLRRLDLEYHDIRYDAALGPVGLFYRLQQQGAIERIVTDEEIQKMRTLPPSDTRAWLRGQCISRFAGNLISADWSFLNFSLPIGEYDKDEILSLPDPLMGTEAEMASVWSQLADPAGVIDYCRATKTAYTGGEGDERADEGRAAKTSETA